MEIFKSDREKRISSIVLTIYLFLLCWLVLFKFAISMADIPRLRGVNLIPFHYDTENSVHLRETVLNMAAFVPAGFYFSALFAGKNKNAVWGVAATAAVSLVFEILQWICMIGASDITDLVTNTIGGLCGLGLFLLLRKITPKHCMGVVNVLGIIIEALGLLLITVLLVANR